MPWSIDIRSLNGASLTQASVPFRSARATWARDAEGALEVDLIGSDVASGNWRAGRHRVLLKDAAGTARFQGYIDRLERGGPPSAVKYRAIARGLTSVLSRRIVRGDVNQVHERASDIVSELAITHIQAQSNDKTGFTMGTVTGTAPFRTRRYCDGTVVSEAIREIAEMDPGGFEWEVNENGEVDMWVGGSRGTDLSATVTLQPSDTNDWQCIEDTSDIATYGLGLGGEDSSCSRPTATASDGLASTYGRLEVVVQGDTDDTGELQEKAQDELTARLRSRIQLRTSWIEGRGPWDFGDVWLGDIVNAALGTEFGGNADVRLTAISITLEPGTHEFVEMEWEAA